MIRHDWCIAALASTVFVGSAYVADCVLGSPEYRGSNGAFAIIACYAISMFAFTIRLFCRQPDGSAIASRPIRNGSLALLCGGIVYGACVALGVTAAFVACLCWFEGRLPWHVELVVGILVAVFGTMLVCGLCAVPLGFLAGVIYKLNNRKPARLLDGELSDSE